MEFKDFYSELGKLMYAIAKADGRVGLEEYETLKKIVREELLPLESSTDEFGTDTGYYAEIEFDFLETNFADPASAFESFLEYVDKNKSAFDAGTSDLVRRISAKIAESELGIDITEQNYLERLDEILNS